MTVVSTFNAASLEIRCRSFTNVPSKGLTRFIRESMNSPNDTIYIEIMHNVDDFNSFTPFNNASFGGKENGKH